ncbi:type II toxin-antitoxin system prevent-host-death family antitoxin [Citricoccus sp. I39-566]|uniref:type II toxin-antitoxin system Phd/YefM family antitoxin n=1 Tax=Citricoccus sp. I39-566 TaxID=3073268 RepID=UPI00286BBCCB|nr:type II toxin-antitoxin system prevent-host-death family antitoxin [Citricoccus sp. I39-566]WMY78273.1 type II toxin-antitoxin system prevent-host-death family antitoxin [Citricoccus sp. I39-566]
MAGVSIRDLRNRSAEVLRRVERGESLTVTRDGQAVATVSPLPRRASRVEELIARRQNLPAVDSSALRRDIDDLIDPQP